MDEKRKLNFYLDPKDYEFLQEQVSRLGLSSVSDVLRLMIKEYVRGKKLMKQWTNL